jgi:16S rRNA (guanine1207-N2)-methyltransferase
VIFTTILGVKLRFETAPCLFSPTKPDQGSLAMLSCIKFEADDKILDLGCGYGLIGIYAAKVVSPQSVWMVDDDPEATRHATRNLVLNGVEGVRVLSSDGFRELRESNFTKIVCNPPYHVDFSVPKHFIEKGFNRLVVGGSLWMVTSRKTWYINKLQSIFGGARVREVNSYFVFEAVKKSPTYANRISITR